MNCSLRITKLFPDTFLLLFSKVDDSTGLIAESLERTTRFRLYCSQIKSVHDCYMHGQHFHLLVFSGMSGMSVLHGQPCLPPDVHKDGPVFPFALLVAFSAIYICRSPGDTAKREEGKRWKSPSDRSLEVLLK